MASAVVRPGRLGRLIGAALAVGFLVVMALSGRVRDSGPLVRFAAAGLLTETPAQIERVELRAGARHWAFVRTPDGWQMDADRRPVSGTLAGHLEDSLKFMHASAPIRVLEPGEWREVGLREFGLDPPPYAAALFRQGRPVLTVAFGAENPQKVLQYMRVEGREQIFVMSRSMGREWEQVLAEAGR